MMKHFQLLPTLSADEAWLGEVLYSFFEKMQVLHIYILADITCIKNIFLVPQSN